MDNKPPIEKRLRSQHDLVHFQASVILDAVNDRVVSGRLLATEEDLKALIRGLDNFRESLTEYQNLIKEAGVCERL